MLATMECMVVTGLEIGIIIIIVINIFNVAYIMKLLQGPQRNRKRVHIVSELNDNVRV